MMKAIASQSTSWTIELLAKRSYDAKRKPV